jgi:hypothetical protein
MSFLVESSEQPCEVVELLSHFTDGALAKGHRAKWESWALNLGSWAAELTALLLLLPPLWLGACD